MAAELEQQRLTAEAQQAATAAQAHEARVHLESAQARLQQTQTTAAVMGAEWRLKHEKLQADTAAAQTKLQARSVLLIAWSMCVCVLTQLRPQASQQNHSVRAANPTGAGPLVCLLNPDWLSGALHSCWQPLCAKVLACLAHLDHLQRQQLHSKSLRLQTGIPNLKLVCSSLGCALCGRQPSDVLPAEVGTKHEHARLMLCRLRQADGLVVGLQARLCVAEGRQQEADAVAAALTIQLEGSQADVAAHQAAGEGGCACCCGKSWRPLALLLGGSVETMVAFCGDAASTPALTSGGML